MIDLVQFISDIGLFIRINLQGSRSDYAVKECFASAQGCLGDVPNERLGNFFFFFFLSGIGGEYFF